MVQNYVKIKFSSPDWFSQSPSHLSSIFCVNILTTPRPLISFYQAEDGSPTIIVRLNETFGGSVVATLTSKLKFTDVHVCDGLEDLHNEDKELEVCAKTKETGSEILIRMSAFQIVSLRCCL